MADEHSVSEIVKRHPAGTAIAVVGGVLLLLRLRQAGASGGGPIPVPTDTGAPNYSALGGQGGLVSSGDTSAYQQQTGAAISAIEQQIQALSSAASQHAQASGAQALPLNYDPSRGAYAGASAIAGDLGLYTAQSAQTLPDACNYSRCSGVLGCIGHFFSTTATCGWRVVQTAGLGAASVYSGVFAGVGRVPGLGGLPGISQVPGAMSGYPGYAGPLGQYGGYGYYTPGIAPGGYGPPPNVIPQAQPIAAPYQTSGYNVYTSPAL